DGVVASIGPEKLQGTDHSELAEAGKLFGLDELFVSKRVGQAGFAVGFARGCDSVEGFFDGAVTDGVNVNNETLLVGGDAEFGEFSGIEKQISVVAGVPVGLGEVRGLGGELRDAVGEDLDAGDVQVARVGVLLTSL